MTTARNINLPDDRQLQSWLAEFCGDAAPARAESGRAVTAAESASPPINRYYPTDDDFTRVIGEVLSETGQAQPSAGAPANVPGFDVAVPWSGANTAEVAPVKRYSPEIVSVAEAKNAPAAPATIPGATATAGRAAIGGIPVDRIRADFPILGEKLSSGKPLIWLDNGATTQRPRAVIDRLSYYFEHENSNIHRAAHELAARSTDAYESARSTVAKFIGAADKENIVFVRGTTEAINLVAQCYVKPLLRPGDEIILSLLEHHANIVPWQLIAAETGAKIRVIPVDADGQLVISEYVKLFSSRTKFVSVTHVSNVLGTITPVAELIQIAHRFGVRVLIDGAQSVAHIPISVTALDADFFVFSGHKVFAPTGIGAVYGKRELLEEAQPYHGGGNMIADVTFERTLYNPPPNKFEAGTGSIADAVGLGAALEYLLQIGMPAIAAYEHELTQYGMRQLATVPGLHLIGTAKEKSGALSFYLDGHDTPSVGKYLSDHGIAVRAGHHCAQPILRHYGLESSVRPSLAMYNTPEEIDILTDVLKHLVK